MKTNIINMLDVIDEEYIEEAAKVKNKRRKQIISACVSIAACAVLAVGAGAYLRSPPPAELPLSEYSKYVTITLYEGEVPHYSSFSDTEYLSPKQIFARTESALKGTVLEIQNIQIDFNGILMIRAVATVRVEEAYLGTAEEGDIVTLLLPCPIKEGYWIEDTEVLFQTRVGSVGIFLLNDYGEDDYYRTNGCELLLSDVADYGFYDGHRFAFIETENGLVFDNVHEKIKDAKTLDEIEEYVIKMLK